MCCFEGGKIIITSAITVIPFQAEVVDKDHVLVRAAMGQVVVREVEGNIRVGHGEGIQGNLVGINKEMYDKFKVRLKEEKERMRMKKGR